MYWDIGVILSRHQVWTLDGESDQILKEGYGAAYISPKEAKLMVKDGAFIRAGGILAYVSGSRASNSTNQRKQKPSQKPTRMKDYAYFWADEGRGFALKPLKLS